MKYPAFSEWVQLREQNENPLLQMPQSSSDWVYFGIHDLGRYYRENGSLPELNTSEIQGKVGQIVDNDPVKRTITVALPGNLHSIGYRNLYRKVSNRNGVGQVTLPTDHLLNINHMISDGPNENVWLAVDGNTKFQQQIIRRIRSQEARKSQQEMEPDEEVPYMDSESIMDHYRPSILSNKRYWKTS